MKKLITPIFFFFALLVCSTTLATPWDKLNPEERAFCTEHMEMALDIYHTGDVDAAVQSLKESYDLADSEFSDSFFMHRIIWWEAQVRTGKTDEAWGLMLYRFLRDREHMYHPQHAVVIPGDDFVLYGNIIDMLESLGMMAQARMETFELEHTLTEYLGFDLSGESYPDHGALFSFTEDARNRTYPIMRSDNPQYGEFATGCSRFIYYCYMYGVRDVAAAALASGDWKQAAELSDWFIKYTDRFSQSKERMRWEVCKESLNSTDILAGICSMHEQPEAAAGLYEGFIEKCESGYYPTTSNVCGLAKLNLARIQIQMDTLPEDAIGMAESAVAGVAAWNRFGRKELIHATLTLARIQHSFGNTEEAWMIVNRLFDETSKDINPQHQLRILTTAIDLALAEGGLHPELEKWLVLALTNERRLANKFNELPLYEKYAQYLMIHGRYDEALAILGEAVRLSKAINIPARVDKNESAMEQLGQALRQAKEGRPEQQMPNPSPEPGGAQPTQRNTPVAGNDDQPPAHKKQKTVAGTASTGNGVQVDIQPLLSLTAAIKGQAAHGRFYLINPSAEARSGELEIEGRIKQPAWQNDQWLTLQASPVFPDVNLAQPITLAAGETCIIDVVGMPEKDGAGETVQCRWLGDGEVSCKGEWEYRMSSTEKRTAVIDAHEVRGNPFYLVPINHTVQRGTAGFAELVDLTVEASSPMRIEVYHASTGKLVYVDANGDGDFDDQGDLVASDSNNNHWPDIVFGTDDSLASITMYVKPAAEAQGEQELTIKLMDEDENWRIDAVDVIK